MPTTWFEIFVTIRSRIWIAVVFNEWKRSNLQQVFIEKSKKAKTKNELRLN